MANKVEDPKKLAAKIAKTKALAGGREVTVNAKPSPGMPGSGKSATLSGVVITDKANKPMSAVISRTNPTKEELAKGVVIQSSRIPKVEDETEDLVKIGSRLFKKDDVEAMIPQLKKIFTRENQDAPYGYQDVESIIKSLSGKPVTSNYLVEKDKFNKSNVTRNLYEVKDLGSAHKIMGYLNRAGL